MLKEKGLVTKIENDIAWVNTHSKLACSSCKVESTCGNGILEKYLAGKVFVSKVKNEMSAKVGDQVVIAIPKASVTKASLIVYCIPLAGLIAGALLGDISFGSETIAIGLSLSGLLTGLFVIYSYNSKIATNERYVPKMVSRIPTALAPSAFESIQIKQIE